MAYRFKFDEKFAGAFRRIVREQVKQADTILTAVNVPVGAVHETRKAIKRLRALLQTAAPTIGAKAARKHDRAFRDIARALAGLRDTAVLDSTVAELEAHYGAEAVATLAPLRRALASQSGVARQAPDASDAEQVREALKAEGRRLRKARLKGYGLANIIDGVAATYAKARKELKRASKHPTDESLHELRKAIQAHWRHMSLLSNAWPEEFATRVLAARKLAQVLGDDHDLVIVKSAARNFADADAEFGDLDSIFALCSARQGELRTALHPLAACLFAEDPAAFAKRITVYWQAARRAGDRGEAAESSDAPELSEVNDADVKQASKIGSPIDGAAKTTP